MAKGETMRGITYFFPTVFQREAGGYGVTVIGLENIFTTGPDLEAARKNALQAIENHLAALSDEERKELEPYLILPSENPVLEVIPVTYPKQKIQ